MIFFPYQKVRLVTSLTPDQINKSLSSVIGSDKEFEGTLSHDQFTINRRIVTQNLYLPKIRGTIQASIESTHVTLIFFAGPVKFVILLAFLIFTEYQVYSRDPQNWWVPFLLIAFIHTVTYLFGFLPEQKWAENRLRHFLQTPD
jgi:hypothetical protein